MNRTVCRLLVVAMMAALLSFVAQPPQALAALAAPSNLSPSGVSQSGSPVLQWSRVGKAVKYEVQLATDPGFTTLKYSATTTNHRATPTMTLPQQELFWRVRSVNASNVKSNWAETSYTASEIAGPSLVAPVDDPSGSEPLQQPDQPALLTWTPVPNAVSYTIEVDDSDDFVGAKTYTSKTTSYLFQAADPTVPLNSWRVRAVFSGSYNSTWSDVGHFTIGALVAPTLTAPIDSPTTQVTDAVLDWEPVPGAVKYEVQVDTNDQFVDPLADKATVYSTWYAKPATLDNDQYWWRVRAIDVNGKASPWASSLNQFQRSWNDVPELVYPNDSTLVGRPVLLRVGPDPARELVRAGDLGGRQLLAPRRPAPRSTRRTRLGLRATAACRPRGNVTYWRVRGDRQPHRRARALLGHPAVHLLALDRHPAVPRQRRHRRRADAALGGLPAGRQVHGDHPQGERLRRSSRRRRSRPPTRRPVRCGSTPPTVPSAGPCKPCVRTVGRPRSRPSTTARSSTSPATSWTPLRSPCSRSHRPTAHSSHRFPNLTWEPAFDGDSNPAKYYTVSISQAGQHRRRRPGRRLPLQRWHRRPRTTGSVPGSTTGTSPHTSSTAPRHPARRARSRSSTSPR